MDDFLQLFWGFVGIAVVIVAAVAVGYSMGRAHTSTDIVVEEIVDTPDVVEVCP